MASGYAHIDQIFSAAAESSLWAIASTLFDSTGHCYDDASLFTICNTDTCKERCTRLHPALTPLIFSLELLDRAWGVILT
jgi:hypothetical protein